MKVTNILFLFMVFYSLNQHISAQAIFVDKGQNQFASEIAWLRRGGGNVYFITPNFTFKGLLRLGVGLGYLDNTENGLKGRIISSQLEVLPLKPNANQKIGLGLDISFEQKQYLEKGFDFSPIKTGLTRFKIFSKLQSGSFSFYPQIATGVFQLNPLSEYPVDFLIGASIGVKHRSSYFNAAVESIDKKLRTTLALGFFW